MLLFSCKQDLLTKVATSLEAAVTAGKLANTPSITCMGARVQSIRKPSAKESPCN